MRQESSTAARGRVRAASMLGSFVFFALFMAAACAATPGAVGVPEMTAPAPNAEPAPQGETFTGTWTAAVQTDKADERIQFTFDSRADGRHSNFGQDYALADFQGLTREQVRAAASTQVNFRLVREAGTIECEGVFRGGRGAGTWRLAPSAAFRSDEDMFKSAMLDVTTRFVDDLKAIGFERLPFEDVVKAVIFKITPQFAGEMKALGFGQMGLEELVKARIFKIDAAFAREVREMGFEEQQSMEQLVKLRIFKVTPDFLKEIKAEGLALNSIEDAVKLRIFKVDADFIRRARASGYTDLSVEELVRLRIHNKLD
jgi:hypothetical protein